MKLIEDTYHGDENQRSFWWTKRDGTRVAGITLYSEGLFEFTSVGSGHIAVERVGSDDEAVLIDQMEIRVGSVDTKKFRG